MVNLHELKRYLKKNGWFFHEPPRGYEVMVSKNTTHGLKVLLVDMNSGVVERNSGTGYPERCCSLHQCDTPFDLICEIMADR